MYTKVWYRAKGSREKTSCLENTEVTLIVPSFNLDTHVIQSVDRLGVRFGIVLQRSIKKPPHPSQLNFKSDACRMFHRTPCVILHVEVIVEEIRFLVHL